jgi:hypothetical protein
MCMNMESLSYALMVSFIKFTLKYSHIWPIILRSKLLLHICHSSQVRTKT